MGCTGAPASDSGADQVKTIKVANYFAEDHPQNVALRERFKPMVEEKSGGALKVEIYPNSTLGAEKEFYDGVRNGTIEMGIPGMIMQADIEKLAVPEWPFLFKDFEHVKKVLSGPIGAELTADLESRHGVRPLAWSANGFRMFSANREITSMADFSGMRIRMPNIPNYIKLGQLLGMNVTPMPISEVFTALEQKVVDGQDNPIATLRASGWYEVQTGVLESKHMFSPNLYIINSQFWSQLSPEQQQIVEEAARTAASYEFELLEQSYQEDKKFLQEHGITFTTPSPAFVAEMEQAAQPLYEEFYGQYPWAEELVQRIKAEAE
ncbi:TRAP transporter substrate-binding protein [Brevibacillus humidisoli]|uniref:TRAP transporter substrate-binding protein n=1 Tax=Brevibacillus humidisoli TaxID=2895522 RepID=UPI003B978E9C